MFLLQERHQQGNFRPGPITIESPGLVSPEVVRGVPSLLPAEQKTPRLGEKSPFAPNVHRKSGSGTGLISLVPKDGASSAVVADGSYEYEAARAGIASAASARTSNGSSILVDTQGDHQPSRPKTPIQTLRPSSPSLRLHVMRRAQVLEGGVSGAASGTLLSQSALSFIISP